MADFNVNKTSDIDFEALEELDDFEADMDVMQKDWNRTENDIRKTGYRLGLSAGQEETLQQGFDRGYKAGAQTGFTVGQMQGEICATLSLMQQHPSSSPIPISSTPSPVSSPHLPSSPSHVTDSGPPDERETRRQEICKRLGQLNKELSQLRTELPDHIFKQLERLEMVYREREFCDDSVGELTGLMDAWGLEDSWLKQRLEALLGEKAALSDQLWDEYDLVNCGM